MEKFYMTEEEIIDLVKNNQYIDWDNISYSQKLFEEFIRDFADRVNWVYISYSQKLSEEFIREFADKVDWFSISYCQKFSEEFIREFSDRVNFKHIPFCYFNMKDKRNWKNFL